MNDLVWYLLGYLDGKDRPGQRSNRCCCGLLAVALMVVLAGGVIFMSSH